MENKNAIYWPPTKVKGKETTWYTNKDTAFVEWANDFVKDFDDSIINVLSKNNDNHLVIRVLETCYEAQLFDENKDDDWKNWQQSINQINKQIKPIKVLRNLMKSNQHTDAYWYQALKKLTSLGISIDINDKKDRRYSEMGDSLLACYEEAIQQTLPGVHSGPFLEFFTYGCFIYRKPIKRKNPPKTKMMLIFNLTFLFRKHTKAIELEHSSTWQTGEHMPKDGRPCMGVVAKLVTKALKLEQVLGEKDAQNRLAAFLKHNPNIALKAWPTKIMH